MPSRQDGSGSGRTDFGWILVILLAIFAIAPLTFPGFFETDSGFVPAFNATQPAQAPRWGQAAGSVRSEGKLPYLLIWPIFQWTGSGISAVKWGFGLAFLVGALGVYAWTRSWLGTKGAVLAAVVYTYLPWHLHTVYGRGAYGEAWLWALWPLVLWAIDRLAAWRLLVAATAGIVALVAMLWIQPGLALLSIPLLVAYAVLVPLRHPWPLAQLVGALGLPLLLLWYTAQKLPKANLPFAEQALHPFQLLSAAWGESPSFQLGIAAVGLSSLAVALWLARRSALAAGAGTRSDAPWQVEDLAVPPNRRQALGRALGFWAVALLTLVLLAMPPLVTLWDLTGFDVLLTYPWQILALSGLPLAFLSGSALRLDRRLASLPMWAGLVALVILASYPYLAPTFTQVDPGTEPVALVQPVEADSPQILLLEADIAPPSEITPTVTVTLTWQAVEPVAGDYTVFVHLLAGGGAKAAQRDSRPCDGECPTDTWQPGEIVIDRHEFNLEPNAPAGPYDLAAGIYLLDTGERATIVGRDDGTVYVDVP